MTLQTALPANTALTPADALRVGTRLEDYDIDCVIARSAVALVYRAVHRTSKQAVAIKEFLPTGLAMRGDDGQVVARESSHEQNFRRGRQVFLDAAEALARREHACLMPVLHVLECQGTVYKVMPYCPGPTLLEYRQNLSTPPTDRLLRTWLDGLLGALGKLHDKGQVHGAVSPGNILMLADDRPVLLDSDAVYAAILSDRTRSMIAALEPCFAPQEQCEPAPERPLGPWTDLYSLAATLRFCVSGQLPAAFAQRSRGEWFKTAAGTQTSADAPAGSGVPSWQKPLDACLADGAQDRPRSVAQLRRLLAIERPASAPAVASAAAALAPMLSSPVPRSSVWNDRPVQDPAPDGQGAAQAAPQTPPAVAQLSLPLAEESVAAVTGLAQPDAGGAMQAPSAIVSPDAAPSVAPVPAKTDAAKAAARSGRRLAATVGSLLVVAMAAGLVYRFKEVPRPGPNQSQATGPARPTPAPLAQPPRALEPVQASTGQPTVAADSSSVARTQSQTEAQAPRTAAPNPPQSKPVSPKEPRKPVAVKEQGRPPSVAKAQAGESSPRQACAGKERYALLQCMETQCAKKTWTKHEQCVRLRKDRKL